MTRRAIRDIVRSAALGSYGVVDVAASPLARLAGRLGLAAPGIHVSVRDGLHVRLDLVVAYGLPVAEVARQVESAVRYALRRALGREPDSLAIHVGGLRLDSSASTPRPSRDGGAGDAVVDLAASRPAPSGTPATGSERVH